MGLLDFAPGQADSLLDFGTGLLAASGPSRMPVSLGQAFGAGMQGMRQGDQQRVQNQMQRAQMSMIPGQLQMQQMQIDSAKISDARKKAFEQMLPTLSPTVQQAYMMAGPEKAFEAMQAEKDAAEFRQMMGGGSPAAAQRPYQGQVFGAFQIDTPEQQGQLQSDFSKLSQINQDEAARVREALIQQGVINAPMQASAGPTPDQIGMYGLSRAVAGRKGGKEAIDYAKMIQPNVNWVDTGTHLIPSDKNTGQAVGAPIPKNMSPESAASNALGNARLNFDVTQANRPTYQHIETADGISAYDPRTGQAAPVTNPITGQAVQGGKGLTESQGKATTFGIRAQEASTILDRVGKDGSIQPGAIKRTLEAVPFAGEGLGTLSNFTQSPKQQQVEQAQRDFVNAVLRLESGAAISPSEFANAQKQYFPQPGDSADVIKQKKENREAEIKGLSVMAGPGAKQIGQPKQSTMSSGGWSATIVK